MQIEATSTPTLELDTSTPAPALDTETADTTPDVTADDATDTADELQPESTDDSTDTQATEDEARRAGLREADYTRKTQELAEIRKGLEQRTARLDSVVQQSESLVAALAEEFQAEFKDIDWGKLAAEDPAEYVRKQHALSTRQQKLQAAVYRMEEAKRLQSQTSAESAQESLRQEQAALMSKIPEWKDQAKYAAESAEISKYLTDSGYKPEDVSGITDHRAVLIARKAMLYDRLVAKVPKAAAAVPPSAPPPVAPVPTKGKAAPSLESMPMSEFMRVRNRQTAAIRK